MSEQRDTAGGFFLYEMSTPDLELVQRRAMPRLPGYFNGFQSRYRLLNRSQVLTVNFFSLSMFCLC